MEKINDTTKHLKVLIVDDEADKRKLLNQFLRAIGFIDIKEATNGMEALRLLKEGIFKLVMSDYQMPNMDGMSLLKAIRADEELKDLTFILISGVSTMAPDAFDAGADAFLAKPFKLADFMAAINEALTRGKAGIGNED